MNFHSTLSSVISFVQITIVSNQTDTDHVGICCKCIGTRVEVYVQPNSDPE